MPQRTTVPISEELYAPLGEVELCYQSFGTPGAEPLLLVMGLAAPLTWWDDEFCSLLAADGFHVVRFDNRDVGRSTKLSGTVGLHQLVRAYATGTGTPPYGLADMATDALALMDHLGWASAHVVGASMGGMIAQTMALASPQRVRSLTSIMSTTGRRTVGWQHPRVVRRMAAPRRHTMESYVAHSVSFAGLVGSPGFPTPVAEHRARAEETWARGVDPQGALRQTMAVLRQPDRTLGLRTLRVPTLVVHGLSDLLVHPSGGRATAAAVPGAELMLVDGMGHDLPAALQDPVAEAVARTAGRA